MNDKACQYEHPMVFCTLCGTWLHCNRRSNGPDDYCKRPDLDNDEMKELTIREIVRRWIRNTQSPR